MTGRGWALLAASAVSMVAGWLLGLEDLFLVGFGLLVALGGAWCFVRAIRHELEASRRVLPARVHAGTNSRVELRLVNTGRRRSPLLTVRDPFDGGSRWARFLVAPLAPGETARAAYRLPTERRGVFDLGPLEIALSDPFGLVTTVRTAAPPTRLTVYPRIDDVAPPPTSHGDDPLAGADHPRGLSGTGEDFYALRPYLRGDDLRKVHWPSSAKADDLMLRQDEMPWQARATVVLDTRDEVCPPAALEILVSAAASLIVAGARHDSLQRLVTTGGFDSRSAAGSNHVEAMLEHLASVRARPGSLLTTLASLRRSQTGGALVVLTTTEATSADIRGLTAVRHRFGHIMLVLAERSAWMASVPTTETGGTAFGPAVRIRHGLPFATAWTAAAGPPTTRPSRAARWQRA